MTARCTTLADCLKALEGERRSKYRNTRTTYKGRTYDSRREAAFAAFLDARKAAGEITSWTPQLRIPLEVNGQRICVYVADFELVYPDGRRELVEVKGYETREWKLKRRLLEALYPDRRLTVVR